MKRLRALYGHMNWVGYAAFCRNDHRLVTSETGVARSTRIWDVDLGTELAAIPDASGPVATLTDTEFLLCNRETIEMRSLSDGSLLTKVAATSRNVGHLEVSNDRRIGVAATYDKLAPPGADVELACFDITNGTALWATSDRTGEISAVAITRKGDSIVTGSGEGEIQVRCPVTGKPVCGFGPQSRDAMSLSCHADGRIFSGHGDGSLKVWSLERHTPQLLATIAVDSDFAVPVCAVVLAVSPDGRHIATGSFPGNLKLWDSATLKEIAAVARPHSDGVMVLAFSTDGKILASGGGEMCFDEEKFPITQAPVRLWTVGQS